MNIYCIRNKQTKHLMRISVYSNEDGNFCNSVGAKFETSDYDETLYAVASYSVALEALKTDPDWYNSSTEKPQWPSIDFDPLDWEVVTVEVK